MKRLFFAFLLLTLLTTTAHAMDNEALIDLQSEALGTDQLEGAIPQEARDLLGDSDMTGTSFDQGLERIFQNVMRMLGGVFREAARSAALVLVIALLAGLVNSMYGGGGEGVPNYVPLVGVLAVATVAVGSGGAFIGLGARTLYELETFAQTLFPAMTLAGRQVGP